ncbi:MAG: transcription elongation factor GreA [Clostridia bacterium]|nr:transcription elongation factor GreA [Clostridia bacterium]
MAKTFKVTAEGKKKLEDELEQLKTVGRTDIAEKIKVARGYGDLSENSEYDEAKNEQAKMEARIVELEAMLKNVEIIKDGKGTAKKADVGLSVTVKNEKLDKEFTWRIVGSTEADPRAGKISDECPVGKALIGHKVGETVTAEENGREVGSFTILAISK